MLRRMTKTGRPSTRTKTLEPVTARLSPEAKRRLMALAQIRREPAYELVEKAFWSLWEGVPDSEKERAEALIQLVDGVQERNG